MPNYCLGWHGGIVTMQKSKLLRIAEGMSLRRIKRRPGGWDCGLIRSRSILMTGGRGSRARRRYIGDLVEELIEANIAKL